MYCGDLGLPAAAGLPAGYICHVANFLPLYASRAARVPACWVDRLHAWHAASGSFASIS
jgi:hypothetical protein